MIPKLQNSKKFLDDFAQYQERIKKIDDTELKNQLTGLLVKLKEQVIYIDRSHESLLLTGRISDDVNDQRTNLAAIKKSLDQKLSMYERSKIMPAPLPNVE
jgi:hypothetical protein